MISCDEEVLPKPKGYLSLTYPVQSYASIALERPYTFEVSKNTKIVEQPNFWMQIKYPLLKASIEITYRPIKNNLNELLKEADKLVYKHAIKAEGIQTQDFADAQKRVYGTMHEISGNAASQIQFHLTDSTKNFIRGALYFNTKPNYDSILPAVDYIKKDITRLMETLKWKK